MYKKSIEIDSSLVMTHWFIAIQYHKMGNVDEAISSLKNFVKYSKNTDDIERGEKLIQKISRERAKK